MSISLQHYININSVVGAGEVVNQRALVGRCFTANTLLAPNTFLQFSSASDVGDYFGVYSEEYYRAVFYFGWISKNGVFPPFIQYARWVSVASAPIIQSIPATNSAQAQVLATWNAITAGSFGITIGAEAYVLSGLNFSAAASFAEVATILQSAIQTISMASAQFTGATVVYSNNGYTFTGGTAVSNSSISIQQALSGTDISGVGLLGWYPGATYTDNLYSSATHLANALWIGGSAIQTLTAALNASVAVSNNFGSFLFLNNLSLNLTQVEEVALWNTGINNNNAYLYTVPVVAANVGAWLTSPSTLPDTAGISLTLSQTSIVQVGTIVSASSFVTGMNDTSVLQVGMPVSGANIPTGTVIIAIVSINSIQLSANAAGSATESLTFMTVQFPEMAPMMIEAATDYSLPNAVQNYMFQIFPGLTALVTDDSTSIAYDALSLNYYGQTQTAGVQYQFYQRGLMQGPSTAPLDQNVYVNEIWLKDALASTLLQLLLVLNELPANSQGKGLTLLQIQGVINQALSNGVISIGKTLTSAQQAFITSTTGDSTAWYQVQNDGYWVDVVIGVIPASSPVQYQAAYTLIYSKNDVIRYISGRDILI
jgi:hypothetical protein